MFAGQFSMLMFFLRVVLSQSQKKKKKKEKEAD